jgi:hypothetical protein
MPQVLNESVGRPVDQCALKAIRQPAVAQDKSRCRTFAIQDHEGERRKLQRLVEFHKRLALGFIFFVALQ